MIHRLEKIANSIILIGEDYGVDDIAAEIFSVRAKAAQGAAHTFWLHGLVNVELVRLGFKPPLYISPATLKKWITGTGKAEKDDMRHAVERDYQVELLNNDNIVDAYGLAVLCMRAAQAEAGLWEPTKYQAEKIAGWTRML